MNRRRVRSMAKELGEMFHQTAMREASGLVDLAYELADSDADDEAAASRLRAAFSQQKDSDRAVAYSLDRLARARERRVGDRAYRIAQAAATGAPVKPVEPACVALFGRLQEMGEMPIGEAYAELVRLVPELARVVDTAEPLPAAKVQSPDAEAQKLDDETLTLKWGHRQHQRIASLIGHDAAHPDPLVKTSAMAGLVVSYMRIVAGDDSLGTIDTSHREIQQARHKWFGEREGYTVESTAGGRYRVTATTTFGKPRDRP